MNLSDFPGLSELQVREIRSIKRHIHQHPETSWHEFETTKYIREQLAHIDGVEVLELGLKTGVVAVIHGHVPGKAVALRADIDGLEVNEAYHSDYPSLIQNRMHACGHDFHTASLIGAAVLLAQTRSDWNGDVVLIFQPAEETTDGARVIIDTGIFEKYPIAAVFGLHNRPEITTGHVVVKPAPLMAAKINFTVTVHGVGGHGSMPHKCVDPIVCAAAIVQNVLTIASRNVDPMQAIVLSICSIHGGTPQNLIVDRVEMTGAMRYLSPEVGKRALERLKTVISATGEAFECRTEFNIVEQVPAVINSPKLFENALTAAKYAIGADAVVDSESALASEDFADYMQIVPGFFYWLGSRKPDEPVYSWHHDHFHTDDDALVYGARLLAISALTVLD